MTVAFARTRTLAKLFADTAKPFGAVAVEDPDRETELLAKLPVTEIAGIAQRARRGSNRTESGPVSTSVTPAACWSAIC